MKGESIASSKYETAFPVSNLIGHTDRIQYPHFDARLILRAETGLVLKWLSVGVCTDVEHIKIQLCFSTLPY